MFERVEIRVADLAVSRGLYAAALATLPGTPVREDGDAVVWGDFALAQATDARPATHGLHVGFAAPSPAHVDAFWEAGRNAGLRDDGAPGPRPQYRPDYYGGFLIDPDGNSIEAAFHGGVRGEGTVDHVWIRVADLAATRDWWTQMARRAGLRRRADTELLVRYGGDRGGSVTLIAGDPPTRNAALVLPVPGAAAIGTGVDPGGTRVELVPGRG
jgi:catechol 2,3-dioxygenase-like lactoylglutathione lyase family enzyme